MTQSPSQMNRDVFVAHFGGVFEHSPWIAEQAYDGGIDVSSNDANGLHAALSEHFRNAAQEARLAVLRAHPDLAGKLAAAKRLTAQSTSEQAGAGLDALTDEERVRFTDLNTAYTEKFGFPFIIAVKGLNKMQILNAFTTRINNDAAAEFDTACLQVERIALLRLQDMLP